MPLNINVVQILLHMLNFVILAGGLTILLYKPVSRFLKERQEYFEKKEADISAAREETGKMKAEYEQKLAGVTDEVAAMRLKAESELGDTMKTYIDQAKQKASEIIAAAEKEAEDRKEHILESAQTEIGELVVEAAQKLVAGSATPERTQALYDEFIRELEAGKGPTAKRNGKKS